MGANIRLDGRQAIVAGATAAFRRGSDRQRSARQRVAGAGRRWPRRAKPSSTASTTSIAAMRKSRRNWRARALASRRIK